MKFIYKLFILLITIGWTNYAISQFVKNQGQVVDETGALRSDVNFTLQTLGAKLFFHNDKVSYVLYDFQSESTEASREAEKWGRTQEAAMLSMRIKQELITLNFIGTNEDVEVQYEEQLASYENYYYPHCGPQGITHVPTFNKVTYSNLYDNIDLIFYAQGTQLKYDIIVHPGGDIADVKFRYAGVKNGQVTKEGLVFETEIRPLVESIPLSFLDNETKEEIEVTYQLSNDNVVSFIAEDYDQSKKLVVDPVLTWATIMERTVAGTASSIRANVHVDASGNFYHQINTYNPDLPIANPGGSVYLDPTYNPSSGLDVYFAQYDVNRNLVWSTYLGGTGTQSNYYDHSMDDDGSSLFLCGTTNSTNFPVMNQGGGAFYIGTNASGTKGWFAKFNISTGAMEHSTYMDYLSQLVLDVDNSGNLVIAAAASSSATITMIQSRSGAYNQSVHGGGNDLFVARFNTSLALTWGTFIGGADYEETMGIIHDQNDNIFILARAGGDSGPLVNPGGGAYFDDVFGDKYDLWFVKLNTSGSLTWSTLYGGAGLEGLSYSQIEVTSNNEIVATSATRSTGMTTLDPGSGAYFQTAPGHLTNGWGGDPGVGFMARFDANGVLLHGTYMGVNGESNYIQGQTPGSCNKHYLILQSIAFPTTTVSGSYNVTNSTSSSNYMAIELDANFAISWASYLHSDSIYMERIVSDLTNGRLYVTGTTQARDFPFTDPGGGAYYDNTFNGSSSTSRGYAIMEFDIGGAPTPTVSSGSSSTICAGESTTLEATGSGTINWYTVSTGGSVVATGSPVTVSPTSTTTYYVEVVSGGCASARSPITVTVNAAPSAPTLGSNTPVCVGNNLNLTANTISGATYTWTGPNSFSSSSEDPTVSSVTSAAAGTYSCYVTVSGCNSSTATTSVTVSDVPAQPGTITGTTSICNGVGQAYSISSVSGATGYTWSYSGTGTITGSGTSITLTASTGGTLSVTADNSCGSSTAQTAVITVSSSPSTPGSITGNTTTCSGTSEGYSISSVSGATSYTWSYSGTGTPSGTTTSTTFSPTSSGTLSVTATNSCGTSSAATLAITVNTSSVAPTSITGTSTICNGQSTTLTLSGGTAGTGATAQWYSGSCGGTSVGSGNSITVSPTSTTTYFVRYEGTCNTTTCASQSVTVNANPTVTVPGTGEVCEGSTITLSPTTGGTWSSSNTSIATITNGGVVTGVSAGSADMTFTNTTTGCSSTASSGTVDVIAAPTVTVPGTGEVCEGSTITLSPTTGGTWSSSNTSVATITNGGVVTGVAAGSADMTFTNSTTGCSSSSSSGTITVNATPTVTVPGTGEVCEGSTITLSPTTGGTWSSSNTSVATITNGGVVTGVVAGSADMTFTNSTTGCSSTASSGSITVNALDDASFSYSSGTYCLTGTDPTPTVTGLSGGTFTIDNSGVIVAGTGEIDLDANGVTSYVVTYTTAGTCPNSATQNISVTSAPDATFSYTGTPYCANAGTASVTFGPGASGGVFSSTAGLSISSSTGDVDLAASTPGTYTVSNDIAAAGGCSAASATTSIEITAVDDPTFSYGSSTYCLSGTDPTPTISGTSGGSFTSTPAGLTLNGTTGEITLSSSSANTYDVTYTTGGSCPDNSTVQVTITTSPTADFSYTSSPYCEGSGTATVTYDPGASGGVFSETPATGDLVINASTGEIDLTTSVPGTYTVSNDIAASGGCVAASATTSITITAQDDASFDYNGSTSFCENETNPVANITGTSGGTFTSTPAGITVDGTTGEIDLSTSTAGASYDITYTTTGSCPDNSTLTITLNESPTVPTGGSTATSNTICEGESLDITASGSTGTGVTYSVFDAATGGTNLGSTPLTVTPTTSTTYYVEAFNSNGCGNVGGRDAVSITVNPLPSVDAGTDETICPGDNVTLTATGTGSVVWSTTETTTSITVSPTSTTTYTVTLTDGNNCVNTDDVMVTVQSVGGSLIAADDSYSSNSGVVETLDVLSNDTQSTNSPAIVTSPSSGTASVNTDGTISYTSNSDFVGTETFTYEICDGVCVNICDTATVTISIESSVEFKIPGGFSPNGDGINDGFVIVGLDMYPDNRLSIFNRWGGLVYESAPYNNDWDGTPSVNVLMGDKVTTGTYFYILDLGDGSEVLKGSIEIKRD